MAAPFGGPMGPAAASQLPPITPGQPTGTFVGAKVQQLRADLIAMQSAIQTHAAEFQRIRALTANHSQTYYGIVAAIRARLQGGTTPGNPILVRQWNDSQAQLDLITNDLAQINSLSNRAAADAGLSSFLLESTRAAYGVSGAIEEDHRQLAILEDEVNKTVVTVDRLLNELSDDIRRQNEYLGRERQNLQALSIAVKNGEIYGSGNMPTYAPMAASEQSGLGAIESGARRPLVVIRFDRENVDFKQALYTAVSRAIERRPSAGFDVVAVSPSAGSAADTVRNANLARRHAERVMRSLNEMGLPPDRVRLSAKTSADAAANEVHIYVR